MLPLHAPTHADAPWTAAAAAALACSSAERSAPRPSRGGGGGAPAAATRPARILTALAPTGALLRCFDAIPRGHCVPPGANQTAHESPQQLPQALFLTPPLRLARQQLNTTKQQQPNLGALPLPLLLMDLRWCLCHCAVPPQPTRLATTAAATVATATLLTASVATSVWQELLFYSPRRVAAALASRARVPVSPPSLHLLLAPRASGVTSSLTTPPNTANTANSTTTTTLPIPNQTKPPRSPPAPPNPSRNHNPPLQHPGLFFKFKWSLYIAWALPLHYMVR